MNLDQFKLNVTVRSLCSPVPVKIISTVSIEYGNKIFAEEVGMLGEHQVFARWDESVIVEKENLTTRLHSDGSTLPDIEVFVKSSPTSERTIAHIGGILS